MVGVDEVDEATFGRHQEGKGEEELGSLGISWVETYWRRVVGEVLEKSALVGVGNAMSSREMVELACEDDERVHRVA